MDKTRSLHAQAGMALVEFALVVPALILLLIGVIEVGRYAYYTIVVSNAARAGAQYGAQSLSASADDAGMVAAAQTDGQSNIKNTANNNTYLVNAIATDVCSCWNGTTGTESPSPPTHAQCGQVCTTGHGVTYVQVQTSGTFNTLFSYGPIPSSYSITSTATMRVRPL